MHNQAQAAAGIGMTLGEFNIITLRQAHGAMRTKSSLRQMSAAHERQTAILQLLLWHKWMSLVELATTFGMSTNSLSGTITVMRGKGLLLRIGERGDYRYSLSAAGRDRA